MRGPLLLLLFALAGCATLPAPDGTPTWPEMENALVAALVCDEADGVSVCHNQPRRATLIRLRCLPAGDSDNPRRILCRYAGWMAWMDGRRAPIASECAYLIRDAAGRWLIAAYPDSEFCEF